MDERQFKVGGFYANRVGRYEVLAIDEAADRMDELLRFLLPVRRAAVITPENFLLYIHF